MTFNPEPERNNDVVVSLAVTLDGYICRTDGSVDYLERYPIEDFDFQAWVDRVGGLVMGRTSFEQAVGWGWTWGHLPTLVLTSAQDLSVPGGADVTFASAPTATAISEFAATVDKRLWVFGGGSVVTAALLGGVVDTLDIMVIPEAIGSGIPLFTDAYAGPMHLLGATPYSIGAVRLVYDTSGTAIT